MIQKMMGMMKQMEKWQDWLSDQTQIMFDMQKHSFNKLQVDTSAFQWADWISDEWMGSESKEEEDEEEEEEKEE